MNGKFENENHDQGVIFNSNDYLRPSTIILYVTKLIWIMQGTTRNVWAQKGRQIVADHKEQKVT